MHGVLQCLALLAAGLSAGPVSAPHAPERFAIGVEYMLPGFAEVYARTGVKWAKAMGAGFTWGDIEPNPPSGGKHVYRWDDTDRLILEYQRAGFRNFHIYVRCINRWASSRPIKPIGGGSWPPKPQYLPDYLAFLRALVQRYDPKSPSHAPGLLYPVEYWEIESEWGTGFWQGSLSQYLDLLRVAYPTVKAANPNARVILVGFFLAGVFEGLDDLDALPGALARIPQPRRSASERYLNEIRELLRHPSLFDVVEFHSLSDWSEIRGMGRFLRKTMREQGYEKPIWVGDVNYTASPLVFWNQPVPPYTARQKPAIDATLRALANRRHPRHEAAMAWFRAEQSSGLIKKTVLAMAEGLAGINLGNLSDVGLFSLVPGITGTIGFHGMVDSEGMPQRPGKPRPAYEALTTVVRLLDGFSEVRALALGSGIHAYAFGVRGRRVYVCWYDDGRRYLPGDRPPARTLDLPVEPGAYALISAPIGAATPPRRSVRAVGGKCRLEIGTTPVFLVSEP
ncbi:MAG: hypothetical protein GX446_13905 [Chthonomonadales bacterium]|nr:hypothetical protein [Chthonomonadales bacterium]